MSKKEKAFKILDRIFDRCEEIDNEDGYSMLNDIRALKTYINNQNKPMEWELVYHDDNPDYYAKYVTSRCSRCRHWYRGDSENKYGHRLSSVFVTNYSKKYRSVVAYELMRDAEKKIDKLPCFCENCGVRLKGVVWDYDSFKSESIVI